MELAFAKEKAEAASRAKTEFLENMRHDIRTPLTGIVGFSDILKMQSNDPKVKEYAENLVASSHALLALLDEILEAIRVSSGEVPQLKKKFSLQAILEQIIDLHRAKAAQKRIELTLEFDTTIPRYLVGDKIRVHRIVLELLSNALNFTDAGFVKLSAILAKHQEREIVLKLIVEDTGIGIPKDKQQEIYVQFKRLTPSYQGIYKGAGLGLSVIKKFIDELDGEIYLTSELGKGSTFTCLLPLQQALLDDAMGIDNELDTLIDKPFETTYAQQMQAAHQNESVQNGQPRILVVEDSFIAQTVAKSILGEFNCQIDLAENGKKAIECWTSNQYDLIFMDIGLPDRDGYEVTKMIRADELKKETHVPIIALTAHAGDENKKRCIDAGMNAVLAKPLTAQSCLDILTAFVPGYQLEEENGLPIDDNTEEEFHLLKLDEFPILDLDTAMGIHKEESSMRSLFIYVIDHQARNDLADLKTAYESGDRNKLLAIVHRVTSSALYTGGIRLEKACRYLGGYLRSGQSELLDSLYQQIITVIEESKKEISRWLAEHP